MRLFLLLLGLLGFAAALSASGSKLLVVLEDEADKNKYTRFWTDLEARGFDLTYRSPKDANLALFHLGEAAYSHLLLLPPKSKGLGPALTPNLLVDFVNAGSNILLALSAEYAIPVAITSLLAELDISIAPDRNSLVVDHFSYDAATASDRHDVLLLPSPSFARTDIKNYFSVDGLIAFPRAVGQVLGNASPLLASILKPPGTAYIYNPKDDAEPLQDPFATGTQISLVSAFQARNNARFTVLGSAEALEDKWSDASVQLPGQKSQKSSNVAFARKLSEWTFKETGVLRAGTVTHHLTGDASPALLNPPIYRVKNDVYYSIELSEYDHDHWKPFLPPAADSVQLEFSMLSPFQRLKLNPSTASSESNATVFIQTFRLPDQHGIFNFFVSYRRPFLTSIEEKRTVTVRHFAHDEWPRSFAISGAWPWIGGVGATVVGWAGFVGMWLFSRPVSEPRDLKVRSR